MSKKIRILSIDGGGIRGIIPGMILAALETALKKEAKDEEASISKYFDFVAGTSTGGILTCSLLLDDGQGRPRYSALDAVKIYLDRGDEIFKVPVWKKIRSVKGISDEKYPATELEEALEDYFGPAQLSQLLKPALISAYDIRGANPFFFKSHRAKSGDPGHEFMVREVARATSAAPTYFECARVKAFNNEVYPLIDGGVFVNNPALCAYSEVRTMPFQDLRSGVAQRANADKYPKAENMIIVSLGTASSTSYYTYQDAKDWGMLQWIKPLIGIMMSGVSETVDFQLKQIFGTTKTPDHYIRIEPHLGAADNAMDNGNPDNLARLKDAGEENAIRFEGVINNIAKLLVANH